MTRRTQPYFACEFCTAQSVVMNEPLCSACVESINQDSLRKPVHRSLQNGICTICYSIGLTSNFNICAICGLAGLKLAIARVPESNSA
jgi:hypothetical protein